MHRFFVILYLLIASYGCKKERPAVAVHEVAPLMDVPHAAVNEDSILTRLAFGSCNFQYKEQPLWTTIQGTDPDLWIWLGDNIYADTDEVDSLSKFYNLQLNVKGYQDLLAHTPVIGIWDDHDYGKNDGGREFEGRDVTKKWMLDFLQVHQTADVRSRPGAYQRYEFGPEGQKVKVLLLDSRYFRDSLVRIDDTYFPREDGTILGEEQWKWLENELSQNSAQVHILGNGIQYLPEEHRFEKWANFPHERKKLLDLIAKYDLNIPILLSGDRHTGEFSQIVHHDKKIVEVTASGLTHPHREVRDEPSAYRVGEQINDYNFGLISIEWGEPAPRVTLDLRGLHDTIYCSMIY